MPVFRELEEEFPPHTEAKVLAQHATIKAKPENVVRSLPEKITGRLCNLSKLDECEIMALLKEVAA